MSRRTETAYKAESAGKSGRVDSELAQHNEVSGFSGYGKCGSTSHIFLIHSRHVLEIIFFNNPNIISRYLLVRAPHGLNEEFHNDKSLTLLYCQSMLS